MIEARLSQIISEALLSLFDYSLSAEKIAIQQTRKDYEGDFTVVTFPFTKATRSNPEQLGEKIGEFAKDKFDEIVDYNVIKGFLNFVISKDYWIDFIKDNCYDNKYGFVEIDKNSSPILIEFSSPNTNKPLHLGHIRNNLLGWSVAELLSAAGCNVKKVNLVNDRGIHICKSMLAWKKWGENQTPESSGLKGDKLVGNYYVLFDKKIKEEVAILMAEGMDKKEAENNAPLIIEVREMLKKWETGDKEVRELWEMMNKWVYDGMDITYDKLGVSFDKIYYESETYLLGKQIVQQGLDNEILFTKENNSVWADLEQEGLDQKLLLRSDGTSVYMTQDLGTAELRYKDFAPKQMIYVVGNEQNYHFNVLKVLLKKLNYPWADIIHHLSYGMVELPDGKMKSREGTVVDADDLIDDMINTAKRTTEELGKVSDFTTEEANKLYKDLGLGALKYFILKVMPKKNMLFNPEESIDFNGDTAPFIQYTYARIQSIIRKSGLSDKLESITYNNFESLEVKESNLIKRLYLYPAVIKDAAKVYSPSQIANYTYELAKEFNQFYHDISILKEENEDKKLFRIQLVLFVATVIKSSMKILGIDVPERM